MDFKTHAPARREGTALQPNIHILQASLGSGRLLLLSAMNTRSSHLDSARQPTGVPQLALLLSLLNIPHAAIGMGSEEAERGKKTNTRLDGRLISVSDGDPELWHANYPCSAHT
jgi:hypothetical protein